MTTDEKVELAQKIAEKLVGINLSEWSKWSSYAQEKGLKKAIQLADVMQHSVSLRSKPKESYRIITQAIRSCQKELESLLPDELAEILGYVRQALVAS